MLIECSESRTLQKTYQKNGRERGVGGPAKECNVHSSYFSSKPSLFCSRYWLLFHSSKLSQPLYVQSKTSLRTSRNATQQLWWTRNQNMGETWWTNILSWSFSKQPQGSLHGQRIYFTYWGKQWLETVDLNPCFGISFQEAHEIVADFPAGMMHIPDTCEDSKPDREE